MRILAGLVVVLSVVCFLPQAARANPPIVELMGGVSSPAPGVAGSVKVCWQLWRLGCAGVSLLGSRNEVTKDDVTANATYLTASVEHGIALGDEYHLLWMEGEMGAAYYRRKVNDASRPDNESWQKFAPGVGGGMGFEFPIADLVGFRIGALLRKALIGGASAQMAFVAGVKFGSEWLGVED